MRNTSYAFITPLPKAGSPSNVQSETIVEKAITESSKLKEARVKNPMRNNYGLKLGTGTSVRQTRDEGTATPPSLLLDITGEIADAAALGSFSRTLLSRVSRRLSPIVPGRFFWTAPRSKLIRGPVFSGSANASDRDFAIGGKIGSYRRHSTLTDSNEIYFERLKPQYEDRGVGSHDFLHIKDSGDRGDRFIAGTSTFQVALYASVGKILFVDAESYILISTVTALSGLRLYMRLGHRVKAETLGCRTSSSPLLDPRPVPSWSPSRKSWICQSLGLPRSRRRRHWNEVDAGRMCSCDEWCRPGVQCCQSDDTPDPVWVRLFREYVVSGC
jgi:hypothetical protein